MTDTAKTADIGAYPKPAYAWYVVGVLLIAYIVSFLHRTILTLLVGPIRQSLDISDLELSLLHGFAFALFYTVLGIPLSRFADGYSRVRMITVGILAWSVMTAVCGFARSFWHMFFARIGVGIGQSTLSPAAFSLLSDYFPPHRLTRALSVYSAGIYVGTGMATIIGGALIAVVPAVTLPLVGQMEPWRMIFLIIGIPGIAVFLLMASIREPARKGKIARPADEKVMPLRDVIGFMDADRRKAYLLIMTACGVKSLAFYGVTSWLPTYFIRTFDWDAPTIGLWYGLASIVFGIVGISVGGMVAEWLRARGRTDSNVIVIFLAPVASLPFGVIGCLLPDAWTALAVLCGIIFFASFPVGAQAASFQEITPNQMRAQVSALYLFIVNLFGIALGSTVTALFTDLVFQDDMALRYSMALVSAIFFPISAVMLWLSLKPYRRCYAAAMAGYKAA